MAVMTPKRWLSKKKCSYRGIFVVISKTLKFPLKKRFYRFTLCMSLHFIIFLFHFVTFKKSSSQVSFKKKNALVFKRKSSELNFAKEKTENEKETKTPASPPTKRPQEADEKEKFEVLEFEFGSRVRKFEVAPLRRGARSQLTLLANWSLVTAQTVKSVIQTKGLSEDLTSILFVSDLGFEMLCITATIYCATARFVRRIILSVGCLGKEWKSLWNFNAW